MTSLSEYYEENLYPLQNGVLRIVENCKTQFFLTGGTALSRAYYHHRYSDDLDFFVNNVKDFHEQVDRVFIELRENGFSWDESNDFISRDRFVSFKVYKGKPDLVLKLDFVNDVAPHFGDFIKTEIFNSTDSIRNMLSNKLTALYRFAGKDVADIREIALHESVNWAEIINEARHKEAGIELSIVADILKGIPQKEFEGVHWIKNPGWETFQKDIEKIVFAMLSCA
jgi:predicted nucleotidyltransferase component of viral defense system